MRNNLLSLFVGAAIAGSVFSSSHAELDISEQAWEKLMELNSKRLMEFWDYLQNIFKKRDLIANQDLCYDDEALAKDLQMFADVMCRENSGYPLRNYCSGWVIDCTNRLSFMQLANNDDKPCSWCDDYRISSNYRGQRLHWLFFEKGIEVFLKYCMCNVAVDLPENFEDLKSPLGSEDSLIEKMWRMLYTSQGGIWVPASMLESVDSVYKDHCGHPFKLRELAEKLISDNESIFREEWFPKSDRILTKSQITSLFAEKFFSDDYIKQVQAIVTEGCFPGHVNETEFRFRRLSLGEHPLQTTLLVKFTQVRKDYQEAKNTGSPEAKEKFRKSALFVEKFCLINRKAGLLSPNLREFILKKVWDMQKEIKEL